MNKHKLDCGVSTHRVLAQIVSASMEVLAVIREPARRLLKTWSKEMEEKARAECIEIGKSYKDAIIVRFGSVNGEDDIQIRGVDPAPKKLKEVRCASRNVARGAECGS